MCGIVGEYSFDESVVVAPAMLRQRLDRIAHRGPESSGVWISRRVGLAHSRLAFSDLEHGTQPMSAASGCVISFNGEIFNAPELREELRVRGYSFRTSSDTEVILAVYETWGADAWRKLNGMFAFALYDLKSDALHLVRDREGIKPLYYRASNGSVEFGSEPGSFFTSAGIDSISRNGLIRFLLYSHTVDGSASFTAGLSAVAPGHAVVVTGKGITSRRWSNYPNLVSGSNVELSYVCAKIRHLLHLSVGRQVEAEASVGAFLSGGLDSAVVVGLMKAVKPERPRTYCIGLMGDEAELCDAAQTAKNFGTEHYGYQLLAEEFFARLRKLSSVRGVPVVLPNEVLIYALAQRASRDVKAVLCGEGADELFGGYSYLLGALAAYRNAQTESARGNTLPLRALAAQYPGASLTSDSDFVSGITSWFSRTELRKILNPEWQEALDWEDGSNPFNQFPDSEWASGNADRHMLLQNHLPHLLSRLDGATMATSVEGRVPFLDRDLVDFVLSLPDLMMRPSSGIDKGLLRMAVSDLVPPEVLARPKRAFDIKLELLLQSDIGQRTISDLKKSEAMSTIFNMSELSKLMCLPASDWANRKHWLLLSLNAWLNRNTRPTID